MGAPSATDNDLENYSKKVSQYESMELCLQISSGLNSENSGYFYCIENPKKET